MERSRILRIVFMILCIFAAGIGIGRFFIPPPDLNVKVSGMEGREISPRTIVAYYDSKIHLTPEQKRAFGRTAADFVRELATTQPRTQERFDLFHRCYPKLREHLRPDQHAAFDAITAQHTQRMKELLAK